MRFPDSIDSFWWFQLIIINSLFDSQINSSNPCLVRNLDASNLLIQWLYTHKHIDLGLIFVYLNSCLYMYIYNRYVFALIWSNAVTRGRKIAKELRLGTAARARPKTMGWPLNSVAKGQFFVFYFLLRKFNITLCLIMVQFCGED